MNLNTRQTNFIARLKEACKSASDLYGKIKYLEASFTEEFATTKSNALDIIEGDTTVNSDSSSGNKDLNVASITGFSEGDLIIIDKGGSRQETGEIDSITVGVLTLKNNLIYDHLAVDADEVQAMGVLFVLGLSYNVMENACNEFMSQFINFWEGSVVSTREYGQDARRISDNQA